METAWWLSIWWLCNWQSASVAVRRESPGETVNLQVLDLAQGQHLFIEIGEDLFVKVAGDMELEGIIKNLFYIKN